MKKLRLLLVVTLLLTFVVVPYTAVQAGGPTGKLVAHYKFDGDFNDASGNGINGTQVGDVSFVDSVNGKGAKFEGGYVEVGHNDLLNLDNGFTFSVWIYKENTKEQMYQPILVKTETEKTVQRDAYYFFNSEDRPGVFTWRNGELRGIAAKQWIDYQKWSLCTVTADSQNIRYYIDGKLIDNSTVSSAFPKSTGRLFIGYRDEGSFGARYFKGVMDDLKIYNYAMTSSEVQNEFNTIANGSGKYVLSRPAGMVAFYRFEDNMNDLSGYSNNGTAIAAANGLTYVNGIAGKALKFDGASYIEVNDSDSLDMDKGFTCSVWIRIDAYGNSGVTFQPIIDKLDGGTLLWRNRSAYRALVSFDDKSQIDVHRGDAASEGFAAVFGTPRTANRWYMVTMTANGEDTKCYVDGVLKQTIKRKNFIPHSMGKLLIGSNVTNNNSSYFKGIMDELRLYNYELPAKDVQDLYNLRDTLSVSASKAKLARKEIVKLDTILNSYKFTSPARLPNTGANIIVVNKGTDSFVSSNVTAKAQYASSNTKVLTVSASGAVKGVGKGTASAVATYNTYVTAAKEFKVK